MTYKFAGSRIYRLSPSVLSGTLIFILSHACIITASSCMVFDQWPNLSVFLLCDITGICISLFFCFIFYGLIHWSVLWFDWMKGRRILKNLLKMCSSILSFSGLANLPDPSWWLIQLVRENVRDYYNVSWVTRGRDFPLQIRVSIWFLIKMKGEWNKSYLGKYIL